MNPKFSTYQSELSGSSKAIQNVSRLVKQVAFSTSTVLILGETGTGKELVAKEIHNASSRRDKAMVKINCAALQASLIESELFGHERGSFTGATEQRVGKFELAHKSTLFLDEIGEMPLELQMKLLRAIQEKEIERIGGKRIIKTDVRIIAATNRNLKKDVANGRFRNELYFRLNVFPITLPSLKERKEDIPDLTKYFLKKYCERSEKEIESISDKVMHKLMSHDWPGNVRELEHVIERCVILATGNKIVELDLDVSVLKHKKLANDDQIKTLEENERDHILLALKKSNGKVFGKGGAAEMLDINVATLNSRIKKLGIRKVLKIRP